ncbi:unnamed protein product, partial [Ixodes persulcatus]
MVLPTFSCGSIRLQAWVEAVDEEHITKGVQTGRPQRFALCERHFTDTCFTSTLKTFLNKYAVPNVDVKNPGHNEQLLQAADSWYRKMQLAKARPDIIGRNQQEVSEGTPDPKEPVQSEICVEVKSSEQDLSSDAADRAPCNDSIASPPSVASVDGPDSPEECQQEAESAMDGEEEYLQPCFTLFISPRALKRKKGQNESSPKDCELPVPQLRVNCVYQEKIMKRALQVNVHHVEAYHKALQAVNTPTPGPAKRRVMSGHVTSVEGEVNFIVKEYLDHLGFDTVARLFEEECLKAQKPIQDHVASSYRDERIARILVGLPLFASLCEGGRHFKDLQTLFDEGNEARFFSLWDSGVCRELREDTRLSCRDLEFQLRVYFAIFPLRHPEKARLQRRVDPGGAMGKFRQYLESRGAPPGDDNQMLLYCALPYVPNPKALPTFKQIFEEDWVLDLKSKMEEFVEEALTEKVQEPPQPRLLELYEDYKSLTGITSELITALEATIQGDMVNLENVLFSCGQQFPELVRTQRSRTSQLSSTGSPLQAQDGRNSLFKQGSNSIERDYFATRLDFSKIKHDLTAAEATQRCLLLQALRWKLTRPSTFEQRNSVVLAFVDNDLLGFAKRTPDYSNRILHMIKSANSGLQQSFTRFLNALASFSQGRSYLSRNLQLVATLIDCLLSDRLLEPKCQDMILGILQKLSLRRAQKEVMISQGIMEWIVWTLNNDRMISQYGLEYAVALFMNLCLQASGVERCFKMYGSLLEMVKRLLCHDNKEILPYLNGALYSLLANVDIRKAALALGLESSLEKAKEQCPPEILKQLEYVHSRLLSIGDVSSATSSQGEEDEDEEESELEPEIDQDDPVVTRPDHPHGDQLLRLCYGEQDTLRPVPDPDPGVARLEEESSPEPSLMEEPGETPDASRSETDDSDRPSSAAVPAAPPIDEQASQLVKQITGEEKTLVAAATPGTVPPTEKVKGLNVQEYSIAFSSRPKIPRTPEPSSATSRGGDSTCSSLRTRGRRSSSTLSRDGSSAADRPKIRRPGA